VVVATPLLVTHANAAGSATVATPVVKRIRPMATPRSKRSILSQKAHRPTPQSRQAKKLAHEREKSRLQSNSMYTQNSVGNKCRISGQPKRFGSALRPTRRLGNESVTKKGRTLIDSVSKSLATPGNDRIRFGRVRFSPTSGATMKKINFNKPAPISTPNSRRDMIDRLTAAMSSISMKQHIGHEDSTDSSEQSAVPLSPLTVPTATSVATAEKEEDSTIDEEVQQLLSSGSSRTSSPLIASARSSPRSAFKRLHLERSHSPVTVALKSKPVSRDASDPLGRTLKCQADVQSKDAIRAFCSGDSETGDDPLDDGVLYEEDEEAVSIFFFFSSIKKYSFVLTWNLLVLFFLLNFVPASTLEFRQGCDGASSCISMRSCTAECRKLKVKTGLW
jgi:hypothetical protein